MRDGDCQLESTLLRLLKNSADKRDICKGSQLHAHILKQGLLQRSPHIACSLINLFAKCGMLPKARHVLEELPVRDSVCWNALISGYAQAGLGHEALDCLETMQREGISPDVVTYICILKACGSIGAIANGKKLHAEILQKSMVEKSVMVGNGLVDMYAKCGLLDNAQNVLEELPVRNVISWSALIAGYAQAGQGNEAIDCFDRMRWEGISPNEVTFVCILKACGNVGAIEKGKQIHDEIIERDLLEKHVALSNALVDMYAKCGMLSEAERVLEAIPDRSVVSWSALIAGYIQAGQCHEALNCFKQMQREVVSPNEVTFACILKACATTGSMDKGKQIHNEIVNRGLLKKTTTILGNSLVDMYVKFGMYAKAQLVLDALPVRDVVSWSTLIAGYAQEGQCLEAIDCFRRMQREGISPNEVTFVCILKACGSLGAIDKGKQIHDEIVQRGILGKNIMLGNALVAMYAKCGVLAKARKTLEELPTRNIVSWNSLMAGYVQHEQSNEAINCFANIQQEGLSPDEVTFACVLKACGNTRAIDRGKEIHEQIVTKGLLNKDRVIGTALVNMYAKCGALAKAQEVFEKLPLRDVVSWSALIAGYADEGLGHEALNCFEEMQREGFSPNEVTLISVLKACSSIHAIEKGMKIHDEMVDKSLFGKHITLCNALVDMYAKCGAPSKALEVLKDSPVRNVVSWNAVISGYTLGGQSHEALKCFVQMQKEGLTPDEITITCVLKACGSIGAIDKGKQIHTEIINVGLLEKSIMLGTALVDMFAKCGFLSKARQVHEELHVRDVVSWSALIAGYAEQGHWQEAIICFERMRREGFSPNEVTFLCVLNACRHSGKTDIAQLYYEDMSKEYGITPKTEHHSCMVVMFGCSGQFDKAMSVINSMPSCKEPSVWLALLGACSKWANVNIGEIAFNEAVQLDTNLASAYVLMANIYTASGRQEDAEKIQSMRVKELLKQDE